jgi:outer membrane protein OmpA-like peptidoglycan-associated protein
MKRPCSAATLGIVVGVAVIVSACSSGSDSTSVPTTAVTLAARTAAPTGAAPTASVESAGSGSCAEQPGRRVQQLPDVVVPAVEVPGVDATGPEGGGAVAGFSVPAQLVDGGCVIEYDAPGGCVGAVEITPVQIPGTRIPETVVPAVTLPSGRSVGEKRFPGVEVAGRSLPGARAEQVCREVSDGELPSVTRAGIVRQGGSRNGAVRPGGSRREVCDEGACARAVVITPLRLEPVRVDDVDVDPVRLTREKVGGGVDVISGDDRRSYVAPGDVLFATDEATLRPGATQALRTIADLVRPTSGTVTVEGHTDDRSGDDYNLALSRRRAEAVSRWLTTVGRVPASRLEVVARGESTPVVPNDSEAHRSLNRRVVVSVSGG